MKIFLLFIILFLFQISFGQQKISFDYDIAGNQISRTLCFSCSGKYVDNVKNFNQLKEEDLLKFDATDAFSYYPNPVEYELYLKWKLIDKKTIATITLFSVNGAILKRFVELENKTSEIIPFEIYPNGNYLLQITYNNGESKTIKIIK